MGIGAIRIVAWVTTIGLFAAIILVIRNPQAWPGATIWVLVAALIASQVIFAKLLVAARKGGR